MKNKFKIEIHEDGSIQIDSEEFSESKHLYADDFLSELENLMGGEVVKRPIKNNITVTRKPITVRIGGDRNG